VGRRADSTRDPDHAEILEELCPVVNARVGRRKKKRHGYAESREVALKVCHALMFGMIHDG